MGGPVKVAGGSGWGEKVTLSSSPPAQDFPIITAKAVGSDTPPPGLSLCSPSGSPSHCWLPQPVWVLSDSRTHSGSL